jgi:hypothetical protein
LRYARRNQGYKLSQMILALVYPIILGLDRLETAALFQWHVSGCLANLPTLNTDLLCD